MQMTVKATEQVAQNFAELCALGSEIRISDFRA
jgi:hypothetical protein